MATCDLIIWNDDAFDGSEEHVLGLRELRKRLPSIRRWFVVSDGRVPAPAQFTFWSDAELLLVILNSALLVSDSLFSELVTGIEEHPSWDCILPSDPRGFTSGIALDYASRPGFDRFVSRLLAGPRWERYDGRLPWLYMVKRNALAGLGTDNCSWEELPLRLGERTAVAQHAFIHSFANYYLSDRAEMLRLLPHDVRTLLEVGGGSGNFSRAFIAGRGGSATLLELNPRMAEVARQQGQKVLVGDFQTISLPERYDCIVFLDVLEHMVSPLSTLVKARQALRPGGYVLLSVPNVGHWSVVWDLLEGSFEYIPVGILCNTHLRFFTRTALETLLHDAGLMVEQWENVTSPLPEAFVSFLESRAATGGITPDRNSLATESFHVLARHS